MADPADKGFITALPWFPDSALGSGPRGVISPEGSVWQLSGLCAFQVTFGILTENGRDVTNWRDGKGDNPALPEVPELLNQYGQETQLCI